MIGIEVLIAVAAITIMLLAGTIISIYFENKD